MSPFAHHPSQTAQSNATLFQLHSASVRGAHGNLPSAGVPFCGVLGVERARMGVGGATRQGGPLWVRRH
jgi:hypothetical protein